MTPIVLPSRSSMSCKKLFRKCIQTSQVAYTMLQIPTPMLEVNEVLIKMKQK